MGWATAWIHWARLLDRDRIGRLVPAQVRCTPPLRFGPSGLLRCRCVAAGVLQGLDGFLHRFASNPLGPKRSKTMAKKNQPANDRLDAFLVEEYEVQGEKRSNWSKIGAAWPHQDGKGYRLVLNAVPVNGVVVLRLPEPKED